MTRRRMDRIDFSSEVARINLEVTALITQMDRPGLLGSIDNVVQSTDSAIRKHLHNASRELSEVISQVQYGD